MAKTVAMRALLAAMVWMAPALVSAQTTEPGIIRGTVVDSAGRPIENADVSVEQLRRRMRTTSDGRFLFIDVKPGKYTVGVRSIGYQSASIRITVRDSAAAIPFVLQRGAFSLPARVTTASRGGLSGVIADTGYAPLANVHVRIVAEEGEARTDERGAFFLPLKPGQYLVRIERDGYARQLVGVTIPENEGREIAAWMVPQKGGNNPQVGANLFEMRVRKLRAGPARSRFFSREEIDKFGYTDLLPFIRGGAGYPLNQDCWVLINGGPRRDQLWNVSTDDIEFIELYEPQPARVTAGPQSGSRDRMASQRPGAGADPGCGTLIVWTR